MNPHLNTILSLLNQMYAASEEQDAKDNIVAALCRIAQNYASQVPFDQMLDHIFSKVPFTGDLNENQTVLKFAFNIYRQSNFRNILNPYRSRKNLKVYGKYHSYLIKSLSR